MLNFVFTQMYKSRSETIPYNSTKSVLIQEFEHINLLTMPLICTFICIINPLDSVCEAKVLEVIFDDRLNYRKVGPE